MGANHTSLEDRMKEAYENRAKTYLPRRIPVIIRLDGKSFHTFTKGFKRPYDEIFHQAMNNTTKYLCANIQGCKLGYTQSDEISLLLTDYDTLTTDAFFGYAVQKICSITASMATIAFNKFFRDAASQYALCIKSTDSDSVRQWTIYNKKAETLPIFDARCFSIPKDEVANYFICRQNDATRNAIQMLGQTYFSHNELHKKSCDEIQEMLFNEKHINFNDMPSEFRRGVCCKKELEEVGATCSFSLDAEDTQEPIYRKKWELDLNIPIFTQDREYIEQLI